MKVNNFFELRMNETAIYTSNLGALDGELFTKMHSLSWDLTLHININLLYHQKIEMI